MTNSDDDVTIRPIEYDDLDKGLFDVLAQLTQAPKMEREVFKAAVDAQRAADTQRTVVAEDGSGRIVATGSVIIEPKLIRGGRSVGHIEDIVVDSETRGKHLGKRIIADLVEFCRDRGCYKVILDCEDANVPFYEKCGFKAKERQMAHYF